MFSPAGWAAMREARQRVQRRADELTGKVSGGRRHTADDADAVCVVELFFGRVRKPLLHVVCDATVAHEVRDPSSERAAGEVQVAHDVERQPVVTA